MLSAKRDRLLQMSRLSHWVHPERFPAGLEMLNERQQTRLLCLHHKVALPPLDEMVAPRLHALIALWPQLARLSLMTGSLGYTGAVCVLRLQSCYQSGDLAFLTPLALQCCPFPASLPDGEFNAALLCQRGWDTCCQVFAVSHSLKQLGCLALPPGEKTAVPLPPLAASPRVSQTLNHIINYLLKGERYNE